MPILPSGHEPINYDLSDFNTMVAKTIQMVLYGITALAVIFLIIGAFNYFTAYGNEERANKGKTTIMWALIGLAFVVLAQVIIGQVWNFVTSSGLIIPTSP